MKWWKILLIFILAIGLLVGAILLALPGSDHPRGTINITWNHYTPEDSTIFLTLYEVVPQAAFVDSFKNEDFVPTDEIIDNVRLVRDSIPSQKDSVWIDNPASAGIATDGGYHFFLMKAFRVVGLERIWSGWSDSGPIVLRIPSVENVKAKQQD